MLTDAESLLRYGRDDWTRAHYPDAGVIVLPSSIGEVQDVVRLAASKQLAIVPSGGRTGLSAGAVACNSEMVLALDRLNRIEDFNPVDRTVRCGAGCGHRAVAAHTPMHKACFLPGGFRLQRLQPDRWQYFNQRRRYQGYPPRYDPDWVAGLKLVTGTGELLDLNRGLVKNNAGLRPAPSGDWRRGTLGIVVEATMSCPVRRKISR